MESSDTGRRKIGQVLLKAAGVLIIALLAAEVAVSVLFWAWE